MYNLTVISFWELSPDNHYSFETLEELNIFKRGYLESLKRWNRNLSPQEEKVDEFNFKIRIYY